jgi:transcriptional regulator with XRE-family HTH domain
MNYDTFQDRLKLAMGGESNTSFAKKCELAEGTIRRYLRGEAWPPLDTLEVIADVSGYRLAWLASGEGPMKRGETVYGLAEGYGGADTVSNKPVPFEQLPELNQRVLCIMEIFDLDEDSFCRRVEMDPGDLACIKAGRPVSGVMIRALVFEFGLRLRWLRTGEMPVKAEVVNHGSRDLWGSLTAAIAEKQRRGEMF